MPPRPHRIAAERLVAVALHVSRWTERLLGEHDPPLTISQYLALAGIAAGTTAPGELARQAAVTGPAISQLLRELEQSGLIQRRLSPADRRRHELALTHSGSAVLASASALLGSRLGDLLEERGPEATRLGELLGGLEAVFRRTPPPPRPRPGPPRGGHP